MRYGWIIISREVFTLCQSVSLSLSLLLAGSWFLEIIVFRLLHVVEERVVESIVNYGMVHVYRGDWVLRVKLERLLLVDVQGRYGVIFLHWLLVLTGVVVALIGVIVDLFSEELF